MHTFTFLRHGESQGNSQRLIQGQSNTPLTAKGQQQAANLGEYWRQTGKTFEVAITSPLTRALDTATSIASTLEIPIFISEIWRERSFGEFEGQAFEKITQDRPDIDFYHPFIPPCRDAETHMALFSRAGQAVESLVNLPEGRYLIVSHGAFLNMVMYVILGLSPQASKNSPRFMFDNTGFVDFTYDQQRQQWRMFHFTNILPPPKETS